MKMKKLNVLFTLLIVLSVTSCTEEIADELKKVDSQESSNSNQTLSNKGMRITSSVLPGFSHLLHKEGNASAGCEIIAPTAGWKAENYSKHDDGSGTFVQDCILDVEELDLFRYGAKIKFDVDDNLCEYVTYTPLKFYQYQPGITTKQQYEVSCDSVCSELNADLCGNIEPKLFKTFDGTTEYLTADDPTKIHFTDEITGNSQTCEFDYTLGGGPNCDTGSVTTNHYKMESYANNWCDGGDTNLRARSTESDCVLAGSWTDHPTNGTCSDPLQLNEADCTAATETWTPDQYCEGAPTRSETLCSAAGAWRAFDCHTTLNAPLFPKITKDISASKITTCDGNAYSCMGGPGTEVAEDNTYTGVIWTNEDLSTISEEVTIDAPFDKSYTTNRYAASFSRVCSSQGPKANYSVLTDLVGGEVEEVPKFTSYAGEYIDSDQNGIEDYIILADHPFNGVSLRYGRPRQFVKPYYSFNCLDKSKDVKAQIRVHIREWDREFSSNSTFLNLISDVDSAGTRLMDNNTYYDEDQDWNDRDDWDDFLTAYTGSCPDDAAYTNKYDCDTNTITGWVSEPVFQNNDDCTNLENAPGSGTCLDGTSTSKLACLTAIPLGDRCRDNAVFAGSAIVGAGALTTKRACLEAGGNWFPQPWDGDTDKSKSNFPKSRL